MVAKKHKAFSLPISPFVLLEAIGSAEAQEATSCSLAVLVDDSVDEGLLAYARQAFRPQDDRVSISVASYFDEPPQIVEDTSLAVLLAADAPATGRTLIQALKKRVPAVVMTLDPVRLEQIARKQYHEIEPSSIVTVRAYKSGLAEERFEHLFNALGDWIVRELGDEQLAFARAFDFVRRPFVQNATQAVALQNSVIAAVFFLPGADMPLMTLNQMRLFLKIAAAYDAAIDMRRLRELAVLVLGGFGFRTLARRLAGAVPVLGWAIRGGVGYAGTLAIGTAAREYFERGGGLPRAVDGAEAKADVETGAEVATKDARTSLLEPSTTAGGPA
jgi:uncharacterized protein (DUF697 family)